MRILKTIVAVVLLAIVVVAVFLWTLPADVGYRYANGYLGLVVLTGLHGTVLDGHADGVSVLGHDLGELDWRAPKSPLLRGRFAANVRVRGAGVEAEGRLTRQPNGAIGVRDFRFSLPAAMFAPALDIPSLQLLGTISGVVDHAMVTNAWVRDADGHARWSDAGVSGDAEARFSDIVADFASQPDGSLGGSVHDDGNGDLELTGTFKASLGAFDAQVVLRARNGNAQVAEALRHIGEIQADGSSKVVVHSRLLKLP